MQRTKCLHVCLHIDWNPYCTFNENNKYVKIADSWEALKSQVKKLAKETSTEQRKEKDSELQILNKDLLELRKLIDRPQSTEEDAIAHNDLKNKIEDKKKEKEEGERIRARVEKTLHDEKPSKYFFNKEKKMGESQQINILKTKLVWYGSYLVVFIRKGLYAGQMHRGDNMLGLVYYFWRGYYFMLYFSIHFRFWEWYEMHSAFQPALVPFHASETVKNWTKNRKSNKYLRYLREIGWMLSASLYNTQRNVNLVSKEGEWNKTLWINENIRKTKISRTTM